MDLQHALQIYMSLYENVDGYTLSSLGRFEQSVKTKGFTYGEISAEAFYLIMKNASIKKLNVFYDLGSGTGKAVLMAYLLFGFKKSIGIEFLHSLHRAALEMSAKFTREFAKVLPDTKSAQEMIFLEEDFTKYDFSDADIVFTHSTCFSDELWIALCSKFESLQSGAVVITVTKTIDSSLFKLQRSKEYGMAWGRATVNTYQRI